MDTQIKRGTPKDVFLHLLAVATLYVSVVAFITLWWQYINVLFPDTLTNQSYYSSYSSYSDPIRWAMAALLVVFPVYILISWFIGREFKADPEKREIRVRKWLWYITLFFSAMTIIIDAVTLIFNFLKGELTTQFFLKVAVILIVAGTVFGYYLWDLRKREGFSTKPKLIGWIAALLILTSIIYGFSLIGTPITQRARRFDEQRVNDLSLLQNQIVNFWQVKNRLPTTTADLKDSLSGFIPPNDPETSAPYEYTVTGSLRFSLCANFKTSNLLDDTMLQKPRDYQQNWDHAIGRVCFERTIDPELYKRNLNEPIPLKY